MNKGLLRMLAASMMLNYNEGGDGGDGGDGEAGPGAGGGGTWQESLPEDVRVWDEVKNSDTSEKFWQQMSSHRQHLGQSIRIPGPDAGKEDWTAFDAKMKDKVPTLMQTPDPENADSMKDLYGRLGRPDEAKGYAVPEVKDGEGKVIDNPVADAFKDIAHASGLTQAQYAQVVSEMATNHAEGQTSMTAALTAEREKISEAWGAAEDQNYTILKNFASKTDAPPAVVAAITDKTMDAATAGWILQAANASFGSKGRGVDDDSGGDNSIMTPTEAASTRSEIMNNTKHPYWNKMDPGHKAAVARVRELIILQDPKNAQKPAPGTTFNIGGDRADVGT